MQREGFQLLAMFRLAFGHADDSVRSSGEGFIVLGQLSRGR